MNQRRNEDEVRLVAGAPSRKSLRKPDAAFEDTVQNVADFLSLVRGSRNEADANQEDLRRDSIVSDCSSVATPPGQEMLHKLLDLSRNLKTWVANRSLDAKRSRYTNKISSNPTSLENRPASKIFAVQSEKEIMAVSTKKSRESSTEDLPRGGSTTRNAVSIAGHVLERGKALKEGACANHLSSIPCLCKRTKQCDCQISIKGQKDKEGRK